MSTSFVLASFLAFGVAGIANGDGPLRVQGKPAMAAQKSAVSDAALRDSVFPADKITTVRLEAEGRAPAPPESSSSSIQEKRMPVGTRRNLAMESRAPSGFRPLEFVPGKQGGSTARLGVTSAAAASLRVALRAGALPAGAELRFTGSGAPRRVVGPIDAAVVLAAAHAQGVFWTPLTEGETQTVEVWIPSSADPGLVRIYPESASHIMVTPHQLAKSYGVGAAASCNEDIACVAQQAPALAQVARSVAKLVYTENDVTYLCTGTLINDGDASSQVPYLYTAAHCISSQAAAATLNTFWFFEAKACGEATPADYRQLAGGATLLYANPATDAALVRLANRAPEGAWFAGWDATPLAAEEALVALHHPAGDLKKLSLGVSMGPTVSTGTSYATAAWTFGSTEGGSSGSGIFTQAGGEYLLRGGLRGGSASCSSSGHLDDPSNRDYYSRLDLEAASLRSWLAAEAGPLEDFTGMWWNPAEPGWGVSIVQDASNQVFATWFTYDKSGQPTWLSLPGGRWTSVSSLEGTLYRTTGSSFASPYESARFSVQAAGTGRIEFDEGGKATLTLLVDGQTLTKRIARQGPASP
jgi:lysyl endopeptidase